MSSTVSVALCTHNGGRFIEQQLRSILEQTTPPRQIVISDDASTDDTVAIARAVLANHTEAPGQPALETVILRNLEPLGVSRNFEAAILATSGDLIALSDQDDVWRPDRLARAVQEFDSRPELDLLFSNARLVDGSGSSLDRTLFEVLEISEADRQRIHDSDALPLFIKRNLATGATTMFRRRLLAVAVPFPSRWVHDEWLAIIAAATGRLDVVDEPLIDYRQHGSNVIGVAYPTFKRKVQRVLESRGDRNQRLSGQFAQFAERLESRGDAVPREIRGLAREKASFESDRAALPTARLRRLGPILSAHRRGRYSKYASQGRLDMVRDLLQPHGL